MKNTKRVNLILQMANILIPLISGLILYYLFCPNVLFVKVIDKIINGGYHIIINNNYILLLFRYYLFDFIWGYSFSFAVRTIITNKFVGSIISAFFVVMLEVLQKIYPIFGTFDFYDIIVELIAVLLVTLICNARRDSHEKKLRKLFYC